MPDRYLGRQIGKYRVIRLLGAGAFAWVYEAIDRDLEIPVALKILRPEFAGQEAAEARFRREAALAARLRHPNIVTVRDVGQSEGASFVAMDLLPLSLARRLDLLSRLPEPETVRLGLDVAAALAIAHAGGIIHRDIKPDNILIGAGGEAIVADFGLARALSSDVSLSATNQVMGTPHYFSPEQARGLDIDGRSDLYSLGVMLYRAAVGRLPFEGDDWYAVARQHVETPPPAPSSLVPDLSPAFEAILLKLLAKTPEERFDTATQLADALATLPTAPIDRGSMLTPHTSSQTMIDMTPVQPTLSLTAATRRRRIRNTAVFAVALAALWATDARTGVVRGMFARPALTDSLAALDRSNRDSIANAIISAPTTSPLGTPDQPAVQPITGPLLLSDTAAARGMQGPVTVPTPRPARPPAPSRGTLVISAPENARLYVDTTYVGSGAVTVEHATGELTVRALIADPSQNDCKSAQQEVSLVLGRGQRLGVEVPVRACVQWDLDVSPQEARVLLTPLDGGTAVETRADARPLPVLTTGRYVVSATSPRCTPYGADTVTVQRSNDGKPWVKVFRMECQR